MNWLLDLALKNLLLALPLAVAAFAVQRWLRRPALAHVLWALVLVKLLTPPLIDVPVGWKLDPTGWLASLSEPAKSASHRGHVGPGSPASQVPLTSSLSPSPVTHRRTRAMQSSASPTHASGGGTKSTRSISWPWVLGGVWVIGSSLMALLYAYRAWRFRRFVRFSTQRDHHIPVRVAELAADLGVGVPPRVIVVDSIVSPMLWGVGQSAQMIFPARLVARLSPTELDSLLLHELAHYWRGDHFVRVLELACHVLYWWNPLVWLVRRQIENVEEECCDAWVLERQRGTRHCYAEALLTTIDFLCERPVVSPPAACGLGEVAMLKLRLVQIMRGEPAAQLSRRSKALILGLGALVAPLEPAVRATSTSPKSSAIGAATIAPLVGDQQLPGEANITVRVPVANTSASRTSSRPLTRPAPIHWATAVSRNGQVRLEARLGHKTTLASIESEFRLDLTAHQMLAVCFAPDSVTFASGHADALVRLWDSQTGGFVGSLRGADAPVTTLHFSPDGKRLAAGTSAGQVVVWELASGEVTALSSFDAPLSCLRWSSSGERLALALGAWSDRDQARLLVWSPEKNTLLYQQSLPQPAGAVDWFGDEEAILVAAWNGQAQVWGLPRGEILVELQLEKDQVSAAAWSPDCPLVNRWLAGQVLIRTP